MIRFGCECGKQLQAHDEMAGKPVCCPACGQNLTVPKEVPSSSAVQSEEPAASAGRQQSVRKKRPVLHEETEWEKEDSALEDRPSRRAGKNSSKAITSLV